MFYERNREIAAENHTLIRQNFYETAGVRHEFSPRIREVLLFPSHLREAVTDFVSRGLSDKPAKISVTAGDSFSAESEAVLNFANAFTPGGGYLGGSGAQEETLCRESTLYASISSRAAASMYEENRRLGSPFASHTFLISPYVEIFRASQDEDYALLPRIRKTAVITSAAPDLSRARSGLSARELRTLMRDRIRYFLAGAALLGYQSLTLGAWGCGAFRHDAADVAEDFRTVLVTERWQSLFTEITFAVFVRKVTVRREIEEYNWKCFREAFGEME